MGKKKPPKDIPNLVWIFRNQFTQFIPQLMVRFSMFGNKVLVVYNESKFDRCFIQSAD